MIASVIPSTTDRVANNTPESLNEMIRQQTERNVAKYATSTRAVIDQRLKELNQEWDIERSLETNASAAFLLGLTLGTAIDRRWYWLSAAVAGFLLEHSIQGWCPPMYFMRQFGVRTASEIDYERYALKAIRGDFRDVSDRDRPTAAAAHAALEAARS